ncbi:MAG: hypothetical protein J3T61_01320 [Candidatus Brocadiales bacterium]|nr:hypothetical protein [Candidatus Bathyanammoxibius sp.]
MIKAQPGFGGKEMKMKPLVYLSGPYTGDVHRNILKARLMAIKLWEVGFAVICTKLSRLANRFKLDSLDDIAGYAQTWEMVMGDD